MLAGVFEPRGREKPPINQVCQPTSHRTQWNAGSPDAENLTIVSEGFQVIRPHYKVSLELNTEIEIY